LATLVVMLSFNWVVVIAGVILGECLCLPMIVASALQRYTWWTHLWGFIEVLQHFC
jgi:hypothetical protein